MEWEVGCISQVLALLSASFDREHGNQEGVFVGRICHCFTCNSGQLQRKHLLVNRLNFLVLTSGIALNSYNVSICIRGYVLNPFLVKAKQYRYFQDVCHCNLIEMQKLVRNNSFRWSYLHQGAWDDVLHMLLSINYKNTLLTSLDICAHSKSTAKTHPIKKKLVFPSALLQLMWEMIS